ncbi:hypothetical protein [Curtobacterium sp. MCJR17_020]|uniref:hypothetical protein n=1 Tax=Curtobacterium sp. MCJR17_020 TaxID=2175619 RepID=UPI000DAA14AE|nr:hypothetical protein [Curtobacterium sp. MCJR17_020]WIE71134.1 hypothetical protein DEJ14_013185 [Curtobacterium sp. MCJR17_020]
MDTTSRARRLAVLRIALLGVGTLAALVLLSLAFGARPASAAEAASTPPAQTQQRGLVSGVVDGLGETVHDVSGGVGQVVGGVVDPVRAAVVPAPKPAPAPAAPKSAPAPPSAPAPAPAPVAPAPATPAPTAPTPAALATAPAVPATTAPAAEPATHPVQGVVEHVGTASRPVTDTVATVLRPVSGTVRTVTDARPVTTVVDTLDHVVSGVPVVGPVVGGDTLGTVTAPVTGLVDDTLGGVGTIVGQVPDVVAGVVPSFGGVLPGGTDPVIDVPAPPLVVGTTPSGVPGSAVPSARPPQAAAPATTPSATTVASTGAGTGVTPAPDAERRSSVTAPSTFVTGPLVGPVAGAVQDATLGGTALLVPEPGDGHGVPSDGQGGAGVLGGSATSTPGGVAAVGIVGSTDDVVSLAAGSRGTPADDAVPASVVGEHDVAPD